ncbi:helix-turn-helix domain-containing protein [Salana multivorans]
MDRGLGERLRTLRESATLTREALAERSGVSVRTIAALELGTVAQPRVSTLGALADAFGLDDDARAQLVSLARQRDPAEAAAAARPVPRELPPAPPGLAGRDALIAAAATHLGATSGTGAPAVWVVSGPPGVGKTALALQVAHRVAAQYADGQLFLTLGALTPSGGSLAVAALRRILTATGLHPRLLPDDLDALAASMRSRLADARLLLVLDDVPGSVDLTPLLPAGPDSAVIVTARALPPSLPAAGHQPLGPLEPEHGVELLAGLAGRARIDAEPEQARRVVELCDRLPVALRVAGSRLAGRPRGDAAADGRAAPRRTIAPGAALQRRHRGPREPRRRVRLAG